MRLLCAVIGTKGAGSAWSDEVSADARKVGRLVADSGFDLITGGMGGVMAEASAGCRAAGGRSIGLLPSEDHKTANSSVDYVLPSGIGLARNTLTVLGASVVIALPGGRGTLEEISYALDYLRPVIAWPYWSWLRGSPHGLYDEVIFQEKVDWNLVRDQLISVRTALHEGRTSHLGCRNG